MNFPSRAAFFLATIAATTVVCAGLAGCGKVRSDAPRPAVASRSPVPQNAPEPQTVPALSAPEQKGDFQELNEGSPGQPVDIAASLVSGKRTIVEFYSPYCGPCMALRPYVQRLATRRPDLAVRSINVNRPQVVGIDWRGPVIRQNREVHFLPFFMIYGPDKRLEVQGAQASNAVVDCIEQTFRKPR